MRRLSEHPIARYVAVDVETNGFAVGRGGRVIEVAAVEITDAEVGGSFSSLVNTGAAIHPAAYRVHGISEEAARGGGEPVDVYSRLASFIDSAVIVAHNAVFDCTYLAHEFSLVNLAFPYGSRCTLRESRRRYPYLDDRKLMTVFRHLGGQLPPDMRPHRALADAYMCAVIWKAML